MATLKEDYQVIATRYLKALNQANAREVVKLFAPDAEIRSPLYGVLSAQDFYPALFADTRNSETHLIQCIIDETESSMALVFKYKWTLKQGQKIEFDCVDIIKFDSSHKITSLQILYDTHEVRPYLA